MRGIKQHNTHLLYRPKNHSFGCVFCEYEESTGESVIQAQPLRLMLRVKRFSLLQRLLTGNGPSVYLVLLPT